MREEDRTTETTETTEKRKQKEREAASGLNLVWLCQVLFFSLCPLWSLW
jgi:hypothetical protein